MLSGLCGVGGTARARVAARARIGFSARIQRGSVPVWIRRMRRLPPSPACPRCPQPHSQCNYLYWDFGDAACVELITRRQLHCAQCTPPTTMPHTPALLNDAPPQQERMPPLLSQRSHCWSNKGVHHVAQCNSWAPSSRCGSWYTALDVCVDQCITLAHPHNCTCTSVAFLTLHCMHC